MEELREGPRILVLRSWWRWGWWEGRGGHTHGPSCSQLLSLEDAKLISRWENSSDIVQNQGQSRDREALKVTCACSQTCSNPTEEERGEITNRTRLYLSLIHRGTSPQFSGGSYRPSLYSRPMNTPEFLDPQGSAGLLCWGLSTALSLVSRQSCL